MQLITDEIGETLKQNQIRVDDDDNVMALKPALKLYYAGGAATWLIISWDGDDTLFGIGDLGVGFPEIGDMSLSELAGLEDRSRLGVERDIHFEGLFSLEAYLDAAMANGGIVEARQVVEPFETHGDQDG